VPKLPAEDYHADELADDLHAHGFDQLRVRRRGAVVTIESGGKPDVVAHARLRRDSVHLWNLEMPTSGAWKRTPFRDPMDSQVERLVGELAWALAPR